MTVLSKPSLSKPSFAKPSFAKTNVKADLLFAAIVSTASFYTATANAAPIYKVVDEKTGQVTFTDRPQSYEQQADKQVSQLAITTGNETSRPSNSSASSQPANTQPTNTQQTATTVDPSPKITAPISYQLAITEPSAERAYRRPAQSIDVRVQVKPALQAGDSIHIYLDENDVAQGLSASIATIDILPGEHKIAAVIKNEKGQVLQQVARTIYVIQNNTTIQNNKKIAKQLLAYQNLPWHQKILLKLRQKQDATP